VALWELDAGRAVTARRQRQACSTTRKKKYWNMTTEELAEATRKFDEEGVADTFRPMTSREEAAWRSALNNGGPLERETAKA